MPTTRHDRIPAMRRPQLSRSASLLLLAATLGGCASLNPAPIPAAQLAEVNKADRQAAQAQVPPLVGALTLDEAIARALRFNLDRRARQMEEAIAINQLDLSRMDLLPRVAAQAGYRWRDEDLIVRSRDSVTGAPSLANPSVSSDRGHEVADIGLTWSLLDFGVSYYQARQNADRALVAAERRRKSMHLLIQDVRTAFWRTAGAQALQSEIQATVKLAEEALADARKAEAERVRSPLDSLRYQRQLLENLRLLEATNQELMSAKVELMSLINLPLAHDLRVAEPQAQPGRAILDIPVERLEELAGSRNAEHREQVYNVQIARAEARKALVRMLPGISLNVGARYDSDSYLIHQRWNEAGATLSFNLLNLISGPAQSRLAEAGVALAEQRRMASQMAVLAQVHIARLQYAGALQQYDRAAAVADVDQRISEQMASRQAAQVQSKLEAVANRTTMILSLLRRYQSLAQVHAAASRLQATLGVEPQLTDAADLALPALTARVSDALVAWDRGQLSTPEVAGARP